MAEYDALILCGGRGVRMGGIDKGLMPLFGKPIVEHILDQLKSQSQLFPFGQIYISANRNMSRYAQYGYPVLPDVRHGFCGPLAGIETVMTVSQAQKILVLPCDMPLLPNNLFSALNDGLAQCGTVSYATDHFRMHPTVCLVSSFQQSIITNLLNSEKYRMQDWQKKVGAVGVKFDTELYNLNDANAFTCYFKDVLS